MIFRILAFAALLFALIFLPWWAAVLLGIIFSFRFDLYIELLFLGVALDALYGPVSGGFRGHYFLAAALFVLVLSSYLRPRMIFYRNRLSQ